MDLPEDSFPDRSVVATQILVVSDLERSLTWWVDVLGAVVHQKDAGAAVLSVAGISILLVTAGPPTPDKPTVTFVPPPSREVASHTISLLVADCRAVHHALVARGATFLTPPYDFGYEVRAYTRDPDGHLVELSQMRESG